MDWEVEPLLPWERFEVGAVEEEKQGLATVFLQQNYIVKVEVVHPLY